MISLVVGAVNDPLPFPYLTCVFESLFAIVRGNLAITAIRSIQLLGTIVRLNCESAFRFAARKGGRDEMIQGVGTSGSVRSISVFPQQNDRLNLET